MRLIFTFIPASASDISAAAVKYSVAGRDAATESASAEKFSVISPIFTLISASTSRTVLPTSSDIVSTIYTSPSSAP